MTKSDAIGALKFAFRRWIIYAALTLFAAFLIVLVPEIGRFEGRFFPVVTDFKIDRRMPTVDDKIALDVESNKVRACKFVDAVWEIMEGSRYWVEFPITMPDGETFSTRSTATGWWRGTFVLQESSKNLNNPIRLTLYHNCWGPLFWTTETFISSAPS